MSRNQILLNAANERERHFDKVAVSLGYSDSKEAFKSLGKKFIELARKNVPSINSALKEVKY